MKGGNDRWIYDDFALIRYALTLGLVVSITPLPAIRHV
jgi:hypothetical protein